MNPQIADKWVAALRSGEYEQTTGHLSSKVDDDTFAYCCLGVLCELAVAEGVIDPPEVDGLHKVYYNNPNSNLSGEDSEGFEKEFPDKDSVCLPLDVLRWAGMADPEGWFDDGPTSSSLAAINDGGENFKRIASLIETHVDNL